MNGPDVRSCSPGRPLVFPWITRKGLNMKKKCAWVMAAAICGGMVAAPALADELSLTGTIRDFKRGDRTGGHLDFETAHLSGRGGYGDSKGLVTLHLDAEGKPVHDPNYTQKRGVIYSTNTFNQWFNNTDGVNMSKSFAITLENGKDEPGGIYTYSNSNFFPIDGKLFGNEGLSHNFHFTFELNTKFTYKPGQTFNFRGDDDVWVYINGVRVIDLGGVHGAVTADFFLFDGKAYVLKNHIPAGGIVKSMTSNDRTAAAKLWKDSDLGSSRDNDSEWNNYNYIDLGLGEDAQCKLAFFFAERHTTQSNFRIDTSIELIEIKPTTVKPTYD